MYHISIRLNSYNPGILSLLLYFNCQTWKVAQNNQQHNTDPKFPTIQKDCSHCDSRITMDCWENVESSL